MQMSDISNLRATIVPKSDQLNFDQMLGGPMTITVTEVRVGSTDEQPISLHYANDGGRPFKPGKTMRKVLILAWGENGNDWVGRSMTLYGEPTVKWAGAEVGGIRISHLSHIEKEINVSLNLTKGKKQLHRIAILQTPKAVARPARTERHDSMVADFETVAREQGFESFKEAWSRLSAEDRKAIGLAERDRIGAIGQETDAVRQGGASQGAA